MPGHAPLKPHPIANLFPMMSEAERAELGADMKANGQAETVKLFQGMLLDGRNRYAECVRLGLPVRTEIFSGSMREALDWVISKNLHRRHLTESQRAIVAAQIGKLKLGDNQHTRAASSGPTLFGPAQNPASAKPAQICAGEDGGVLADTSGVAPEGETSAGPDVRPAEAPAAPPPSQGERAEMAKVSRRLVQHADDVVAKGTPELVEKVKQGEIRVSAAAEIAERPIEEQKAILDNLPRDADGKLTAEAKKEVRKIAKEVRAEDQAEKKKKRDAKEKELGDRIRALPDVKAGLILSDIEWHFKVRSKETGMDRHAANHYVTAEDCDTAEAIVARIGERFAIAADDCIHLMWVPACFSAIGHRVMELLGFTYVSQFAWIKPGLGTGFWVRDCHELLFIGVKGKIPAPNMGEQFKSAIEAPKGEHSAKPDFQYEIAEKYFPNLPKVELNARRARIGWIQWGNQLPDEPSLNLDAPADQPDTNPGREPVHEGA